MQNIYNTFTKYPNVARLYIKMDDGTEAKIYFDRDKLGQVRKLTWKIKLDSKNNIRVVSGRYSLHLFILNCTRFDGFGYFKNSDMCNMLSSNMVFIRRNTYILGDKESILEIRSNAESVNNPIIVKFSTERYNLIKNHIWCISNKYCATKDHTRADGIISTLMHRLIVGEINIKPGEVVDHINQNKLDNTDDNLRITNQSVNMRNVTHLNKPLKNGVFRDKYYYIANSPDPNKQVKMRRKYFSISKYGEDEAYNLAVAQRLKWEVEMGGFCVS